MGPTGTGKSSLIQLITGDKNIKIGHNVQSETSQISFAKYHKEDGLCVTLIDTPGFDDSREGETDVVVLKKIASFRFINGKKFKGIIYLHRITDPRIGGVAARNLRMFKQLCGPSALGNVVVVTTLWDRIKEEEGMRREQDLMTNPKFFRPFAEAGAHFLRHDNTPESAYRIIEQLMGNEPTELQIQKELADGKPLEDTAAGLELNSEINALIEKHKNEMETLRNEMEDAIAENDDVLRRELDEECEKLRQELEKWDTEKKRLKEGIDLTTLAHQVMQRGQEVSMTENNKRAKQKKMIDGLRSELSEEKLRREKLEATARLDREAREESDRRCQDLLNQLRQLERQISRRANTADSAELARHVNLVRNASERQQPKRSETAPPPAIERDDESFLHRIRTHFLPVITILQYVKPSVVYQSLVSLFRQGSSLGLFQTLPKFPFQNSASRVPPSVT